LLTKRLVTHALTPHLQHEIPKLEMVSGRVEHIKRLIELAGVISDCQNQSERVKATANSPFKVPVLKYCQYEIWPALDAFKTLSKTTEVVANKAPDPCWNCLADSESSAKFSPC